MSDEIIIETSTPEVVEVGVPGPQGPKGDKGDPGDVAGLPLTTTGDTLYRAASGQNASLPIGTSGQILKVAASGIPEWGAAPASGVTSVNGETGAVTLDSTDVGALQASFNTETFFYDDLGGTGTMTLPARRNALWTIDFLISGGTRTLMLPSDALEGDRIRVNFTAPANTTVIVRIPRPGNSVVLTTVSGEGQFTYAAQVTRLVTGIPIWSSYGTIQANLGLVPATVNSTGEAGSFAFTSQAMYVCIATNTWRRVPIAAF
jgi:hypothetical protein